MFFLRTTFLFNIFHIKGEKKVIKKIWFRSDYNSFRPRNAKNRQGAQEAKNNINTAGLEERSKTVFPQELPGRKKKYLNPFFNPKFFDLSYSSF